MSGNLFDHYGVPGGAGATSRVGQPIGSNIFGVVTRKGAGAVGTAGQAGVEANDMLPAHRGGLAPIEDVQGMATSALDKARQEALADYSSDAASAAADKRGFDFQPIEAALPDPATARTFDGIHLTDILRLRAKLDEIIGKVKASDPAAQTPQRTDELKRAVAAPRAWNLPRSPERAAGGATPAAPTRLWRQLLCRSRIAPACGDASAQGRERTPRGGKKIAMVRSSASCGRPFWAPCDSNLCDRSD